MKILRSFLVPGACLLFGPLLSAATYYVDDTNGLDSNAGTSPATAWQTIARVSNGPANNGGGYTAGDNIRFKSGGTFSGRLAPIGSGTGTSPITIDRYGSGDTPILTNPTTSMAFGQSVIYLRNVQGYVIRNLALTTPGGSGGITVTIDHSGTYSYYRIDNIQAYDLGTSNTSATTSERRNAGGILFNNSLTSGGKFDDVQITNCTIWHVAGVGIQSFAKTISDTVPTALRMTNSVLRNCVVHLCDNDGIIWRGADGALIEYCTVFDTGNLQDHAMVGLWIKQSSGSIIQHCESYLNTGNTTDSQGFDFDIDVDTSVLQWSYSHDNDGGFAMICAIDASGNLDTGNVIRGNVSQNDHRSIFTFWGRVRSSAIYHNTIYAAAGTSLGRILKLGNNYSGSTSEMNAFQNNIVQCEPAAIFDADASVSWTYNTFYGASLGTIPSGTGNAFQNPQFNALNSSGLGLGSTLGYRLSATSPCRAAGTPIGSGLLDYTGSAISTTSPDQGAFVYQDGSLLSVPAAPGAIGAAPFGTAQLLVTWTGSGSTDAFCIERKVIGGTYAEIGAAAGSETRFVDAFAAGGTTYTYRIRARNAAGDSSYSSETTVTAL